MGSVQLKKKIEPHAIAVFAKALMAGHARKVSRRRPVNISYIRENCSLTPIFLIVSWFTFCSLPAHGAVAGERKFHLVYLVSAEKVEVGAKVYVEPLFFTDGHVIKSFYDYCRQVHRNAKTSPSANELGDDPKLLHDYCSNRATTLRGNSYFMLNNSEVRIQVKAVEFQPSAFDSGALVPPVLPNVGTTTISHVHGIRSVTISTTLLRHAGPQHFFLMAASESLVRQIVPVKHYEASEIQPLLKRAEKYAEESKGRINAWFLEYEKVGGPSHVKFYQGSSPRFQNLPVELVSPIVVDVDKDGSNDLIVGMRSAPVDFPREHTDVEFQWAAVGIVFGNGETWQTSNVSQSVSYYDRLSTGGVRHAPTVLMRIGECSYLLSLVDEAFMSYGLMALPKETSQCKYQRYDKFQFKH